MISVLATTTKDASVISLAMAKLTVLNQESPVQTLSPLLPSLTMRRTRKRTSMSLSRFGRTFKISRI